MSTFVFLFCFFALSCCIRSSVRRYRLGGKILIYFCCSNVSCNAGEDVFIYMLSFVFVRQSQRVCDCVVRLCYQFGQILSWVVELYHIGAVISFFHVKMLFTS